MYALGIDLGTTYTAAAVWRDGRAEIVSLGDRTAAIPSVVLLREDETFLTGEAANRRGLTEPNRVAREFKRRIGDTTPIMLGGTPHSAESLTSRLLRAVLAEVVKREGGPPAQVCVSHPANWGPYKTDLLGQAVRMADLPSVLSMTEPEAAATHYAQEQRLGVGAVVAVYDLGGGTFDAAVLRRTAGGFAILGKPEGIERLGGIDFDAAVFNHVRTALGGKLDELDEDDPAAIAAVARLRDECVQAKEALSSDTDTTIPILLPTVTTDVRLTRGEFEAMVRPALHGSIEALRRAVRSAGCTPEQVHSVLLVGGSSRMPIVGQLVSAELGRPVAVDTHPKHAVALGAAWRAGAALAGPGRRGSFGPGGVGPGGVGPAGAGAAGYGAAGLGAAGAGAAAGYGAAGLGTAGAGAAGSAGGSAQYGAGGSAAGYGTADAGGGAGGYGTAGAGGGAGAAGYGTSGGGAAGAGAAGAGGYGTSGAGAPGGSGAGTEGGSGAAGGFGAAGVGGTGYGPAASGRGPQGSHTRMEPAGGRPDSARGSETVTSPAVGRDASAGRRSEASRSAGPDSATRMRPVDRDPVGPPPAEKSDRKKRLLALGVAGAVVALLAGGGVALALINGDDNRGQATSTPPSTTTPTTANSLLPLDEQCTDAIMANPRWVCLTAAVVADGKITIQYVGDGGAMSIDAGQHLHIYGSDGTSPPDSIMGQQVPESEQGKWYVEDQRPAVLDLTDQRYILAIGDAPKVCARIATADHVLVKDKNGTYKTGNCVPITRGVDTTTQPPPQTPKKNRPHQTHTQTTTTETTTTTTETTTTDPTPDTDTETPSGEPGDAEN